MTKYRLLKDIPGIQAGAIFDTNDDQDFSLLNWRTESDGLRHGNSHTPYGQLPEWFERIVEPDIYILGLFREDKPNMNYLSENTRLAIIDQQLPLVINAINGLLEYIQTPIPKNWRKVDETPRDKNHSDGNFISLADKARLAISEGDNQDE